MNDMTSDSSDSLHRAVTGAILCVTLLLFLIVPYSTFAVRSEWQQRVDYNIDVTLVDSLHSLRGRAELFSLGSRGSTRGERRGYDHHAGSP